MYVDAMAMYVQIKHHDDYNDVRMIMRIMVMTIVVIMTVASRC